MVWNLPATSPCSPPQQGSFAVHDLDSDHHDRVQRVDQDGAGLSSARRPVSQYSSANFCATTSGHFHTRTLFNTIAEPGVDRVMFFAGYPHEAMQEAATWFDVDRDLPEHLGPPKPTATHLFPIAGRYR